LAEFDGPKVIANRQIHESEMIDTAIISGHNLKCLRYAHTFCWWGSLHHSCTNDAQSVHTL